MADIADTHLIALKRGKPKRGRLGKRRPRRHQARAACDHFRLGRRRRRALRQTLRRGLVPRGQDAESRRYNSQQRAAHGLTRTDPAKRI